MTADFLSGLPSYVPPLGATAAVFLVTGVFSLADFLRRTRRRYLQPRRPVLMICCSLLGLALALYCFKIGLDRADKLASVIGLFVSFVSLGLVLWSPRLRPPV